MLAVGPDGQLRAEVPLGEGIGQLAVHLEMVQALGVREEIESEDPHARLLAAGVYREVAIAYQDAEEFNAWWRKDAETR
jgi:hypothetical protein